jgi:hypothetical protein
VVRLRSVTGAWNQPGRSEDTVETVDRWRRQARRGRHSVSECSERRGGRGWSRPVLTPGEGAWLRSLLPSPPEAHEAEG